MHGRMHERYPSIISTATDDAMSAAWERVPESTEGSERMSREDRPVSGREKEGGGVFHGRGRRLARVVGVGSERTWCAVFPSQACMTEGSVALHRE